MRLYGVLAWPEVIVFVKVGSRVWSDLIDEFDRIDTRSVRIRVTEWYTAVLWLFGFATRLFPEL